MKSIHWILSVKLLFLCVLTSAHEGESKRYVMPEPFSIDKRTKDTTLDKGKTVLVLNFRGGIAAGKKTEIRFGYNKKEIRITTDTNGRVIQTLPAGKYKLYFYLNSTYDEIITDSIKLGDQEVVEAVVRFQKAEVIRTVKKPVIYVYTPEKTEMKIQLDINGKLGFTWPVYHESWKFTATPEGKIYMDGKEYNYLFWESEMPEYALDKNDQSGFLVSSDTLLSFLENSLNQMGFTASESADFITFWYPQMIKNENNYVKFLFNENCDSYAKLNISPKPDHVFRVGMIWNNAISDSVPEAQVIPSLTRDGITVIEWGGIEMDWVMEK